MRGAMAGRSALGVDVGGGELGGAVGFRVDGVDGGAVGAFGVAPIFGGWSRGGEEGGKKEERAGKVFMVHVLSGGNDSWGSRG